MENKKNPLACNKGTRDNICKKATIDEEFEYIKKKNKEIKEKELEYRYMVAKYKLYDSLGGSNYYIDNEGNVVEHDDWFDPIRVVRKATETEIELQKEKHDLSYQLSVLRTSDL